MTTQTLTTSLIALKHRLQMCGTEPYYTLLLAVLSLNKCSVEPELIQMAKSTAQETLPKITSSKT
jgi:hypothetical protein